MNALAAAPMGRGLVLVFSGGDDQALHAALLAFSLDPGDALTAAPAVPPTSPGESPVAPEGSATDERGIMSASQASDGADTHEPTLEPPQRNVAVAMNVTAATADDTASQSTSDGGPATACGPKGHAAALEAQSRPAVLECRPGANVSVASTDGSAPGTAPGAVGVRLLGSCRLANAHSSALRGAWTDGRCAVTVGLDQRVRVWGLEVKPAQAQAPAADRNPMTDDGNVDVQRQTRQLDVCSAPLPPAGPHESCATSVEDHSSPGNMQTHEHLMLELNEQACAYTQVLEPEDMTVVVQPQRSKQSRDGGGIYQSVFYIAVVGRGTEVLVYDAEQRDFVS